MAVWGIAHLCVLWQHDLLLLVINDTKALRPVCGKFVWAVSSIFFSSLNQEALKTIIKIKVVHKVLKLQQERLTISKALSSKVLSTCTRVCLPL